MLRYHLFCSKMFQRRCSHEQHSKWFPYQPQDLPFSQFYGTCRGDPRESTGLDVSHSFLSSFFFPTGEQTQCMSCAVSRLGTRQLLPIACSIHPVLTHTTFVQDFQRLVSLEEGPPAERPFIVPPTYSPVQPVFLWHAAHLCSPWVLFTSSRPSLSRILPTTMGAESARIRCIQR